MTGEDPVSTETTHRHLLGRTFKVTECDADPEFVAKVTRIQDQLSPATLNNDPQNTSAPDADVTDGEPVQSSDQEPESSSENIERNEEGMDVGDVPLEDSEVMVEEDISEEQSKVLMEENVPREESEVAKKAHPQVESDGPCFSCPKKEEKESYGTDSDDSASFVKHRRKDPQTSSNLEEPIQNKDANKTDESPLLESEQDLSLQNEDRVDSGKNPGYSSQETIPEDDSMEVEEQEVARQEGYDETTIAVQSNSNSSVSDRISLVKYSQAEWKGTTFFAECMRLGYSKIVNETGCAAMRRIRGDNYCGLRAASFQLLSQNLNVLRTWGNGVDDIVNIPQNLLQNHQCTWLRNWSFAGRLKVTQKKAMETMKQCLVEFNEQLKVANSLESYPDRTRYFLDYFNSGSTDEVLIFEAMKLLMLYSAVLLYEDQMQGKEVPFFAQLLFLRDTCEAPEQLMSKHLNTVGDTGGLEQVEMFLLGYALNLTIRVARPSKVEDDFISYYPDDHKDDWDMCNLIAEDDRHYNILVH